MKLILHTGINSKDQKRVGSLLEMIGEPDDTIRDCNSANEFRVYLQSILESEGMVDPEVISLFDIVMSYSDSRAHKTHFEIDYCRKPGCPQWLVNRCMGIYTAIKKTAKQKKKMYDEYLEKKAKKVTKIG